MRVEGSKNISPWFSKFISKSITLNVLLENDRNFSEVINGIDFVLAQCVYPSMTYLCKRPLSLGFVQASGAHYAYWSRIVSCCGFVHTERCLLILMTKLVSVMTQRNICQNLFETWLEYSLGKYLKTCPIMSTTVY